MTCVKHAEPSKHETVLLQTCIRTMLQPSLLGRFLGQWTLSLSVGLLSDNPISCRLWNCPKTQHRLDATGPFSSLDSISKRYEDLSRHIPHGDLPCAKVALAWTGASQPGLAGDLLAPQRFTTSLTSRHTHYNLQVPPLY